MHPPSQISNTTKQQALTISSPRQPIRQLPVRPSNQESNPIPDQKPAEVNFNSSLYQKICRRLDEKYQNTFSPFLHTCFPLGALQPEFPLLFSVLFRLTQLKIKILETNEFFFSKESNKTGFARDFINIQLALAYIEGIWKKKYFEPPSAPFTFNGHKAHLASYIATLSEIKSRFDVLAEELKKTFKVRMTPAILQVKLSRVIELKNGVQFLIDLISDEDGILFLISRFDQLLSDVQPIPGKTPELVQSLIDQMLHNFSPENLKQIKLMMIHCKDLQPQSSLPPSIEAFVLDLKNFKPQYTEIVERNKNFATHDALYEELERFAHPLVEKIFFSYQEEDRYLIHRQQPIQVTTDPYALLFIRYTLDAYALRGLINLVDISRAQAFLKDKKFHPLAIDYTCQTLKEIKILGSRLKEIDSFREVHESYRKEFQETNQSEFIPALDELFSLFHQHFAGNVQDFHVKFENGSIDQNMIDLQKLKENKIDPLFFSTLNRNLRRHLIYQLSACRVKAMEFKETIGQKRHMLSRQHGDNHPGLAMIENAIDEIYFWIDIAIIMPNKLLHTAVIPLFDVADTPAEDLIWIKEYLSFHATPSPKAKKKKKKKLPASGTQEAKKAEPPTKSSPAGGAVEESRQRQVIKSPLPERKLEEKPSPPKQTYLPRPTPQASSTGKTLMEEFSRLKSSKIQKFRKFDQFLRMFDFVQSAKTTGSHAHYEHPNHSGTVTVPIHREIAEGTIHAIVKQAAAVLDSTLN